MDNKVTIITPVYNAENFISNVIKSILCQTYSNLEVILIDDASTDNTHSLIKNYANFDDRIIHLRNKINRGVSYATNRGMKIATGKYITFHDHDDIMLKDKIKNCVLEIDDRDEYIGVLSTGTYVDANYIALNKMTEVPVWIIESPFMVRNFERSYIPTWSMFLRKKYLAGCLFDDKIDTGNQDFDYFLRLLYIKRKYIYLDEPQILFRQSENSLSHHSSSASITYIYSKHDLIDIEKIYRHAGYADDIILYALAIISFYKNDIEKAYDFFKYFVEHYPQHDELNYKANFMLSTILFLQNRFVDSINILQNLLNYFETPEILNNIGVNLRKINAISSDISDIYFINALKKLPNYIDARKNIENNDNFFYTKFPLRNIYKISSENV
jgi:glycosyltransferase involved in cell wall biosynthesis